MRAECNRLVCVCAGIDRTCGPFLARSNLAEHIDRHIRSRTWFLSSTTARTSRFSCLSLLAQPSTGITRQFHPVSIAVHGDRLEHSICRVDLINISHPLQSHSSSTLYASDLGISHVSTAGFRYVRSAALLTERRLTRKMRCFPNENNEEKLLVSALVGRNLLDKFLLSLSLCRLYL